MSRNTIILKGQDTSRYEEGRAGAVVIKPGYLLTRDTDGTLIPHNVAGGTFTGAMVAVEDPHNMGMTVTGAYAASDLIKYHIMKPGEQCQLVLNAGETALANSKLSSNGDGTMQVVASTEGVEFMALEALDLSAGGAVDTLIPCVRL